MTELSWRRNNLATFTRFSSPLHFAFAKTSAADSPVVISHSPVDRAADSDIIAVQVSQRLETVNCVWDAATALCGFLISESDAVLRRCIETRGITDLTVPFHVVEIGSGCGLVGITAGKCLEVAAQRMSKDFHVTVIMTDLAEETKVLQDTVDANVDTLDSRNVVVEPLCWGSTEEFQALRSKYPSATSNFVNLVLATDIVYEIQHFDALISTLNELCPRFSKTLMLMAMERRWSDVTGFWWTDCKRSGWKFEKVSKEVIKDAWWGQVDEIDFYWMWR
ncbi:Methyltransferase-like protein 21A [Chytriomyces hyalinus]|nr:Methyltransferase-like protein 21A [Chytriomyces hyalinus]